MNLNNLESFEPYWNFYIELEEQFLNICKYIPIDDKNENTFSFKYMNLFFSICSEIDTIFKEFMEFKGYNKTKPGMEEYKNFMKENFPKFSSEIVTCYKTKELKPFENWEINNSSPLWWKDYNDIKHHRTKKGDEGNEYEEHYKKSTQKNILNGLSGLYQLETYLYKELIDKYDSDSFLKIPLPQSKMFRIKNRNHNKQLIDNRYTIRLDEKGHLILYAPPNSINE